MMRSKDSTMINPINMRLRNPFQIIIPHSWTPGDTFKIVLTGATDLFHATADTLRAEILLNEKENTGEISVARGSSSSIFWVESKGKKFLPNASPQDGAIVFSELSPGEYTLFELIDENGNGKFDPLNVKKRHPSERVFRSESITVRANWTSEISPPSKK